MRRELEENDELPKKKSDADLVTDPTDTMEQDQERTLTKATERERARQEEREVSFDCWTRRDERERDQPFAKSSENSFDP